MPFRPALSDVTGLPPRAQPHRGLGVTRGAATHPASAASAVTATPARRQALQRMGGLVLLLGSAELAWGAAIVAVRVWPARDYTRVTIESDRALVARHQLTEQPYRLVVDIDQLDLSPALRELVGKVKPDDPYIAGVRVGQYQPKVVRLVLDLKQPVAPQQLALAPVAAYQHRLVFDLYPTEAPDPLLDLLREKERASTQAARAVQDALGDFIGQLERPPALPGPGAQATSAGAGQAPSPLPPPGAALPVPKPSASPGPGLAPGAEPAPAPGSVPPLPAGAGPHVPAGTASQPSAGLTPRATPAAAVPPAAAPPPARMSPAPAPEPSEEALRSMDRLVVVAIDPGHGGEDPGAIGPSGLREKDVVLAIGLKLRDRLNAVPGMRAMMTRDADFFVPLAERVRKARRVQADLFVSIHADAFFTPAARGASVFALSESGASSAAARWMANKENAADAVGGASTRAVKDPQLARTLLDMSTAAQIKDSLKLGREVLDRMGQVGRLHKRQVEQAGFAVLKAPDVPSILVETAFISNPEEEARLADPDYQDRLVAALYTGIRRYFARNPPLARHRSL